MDGSDLAAALIQAWEEASGKGHLVAKKDLQPALMALIREAGIQSAAVAQSPILQQTGFQSEAARIGLTVIEPLEPLGPDPKEAPRREPDRPGFLRRLAQADLGISEAIYGIAETGTLVLFDRSGMGDPISLLPPVFIALLRRERIAPSLEEIMPMLASRKSGILSPGNRLILMTGPSRTADIEQVLVKGVHGPKTAHLVIVD